MKAGSFSFILGTPVIRPFPNSSAKNHNILSTPHLLTFRMAKLITLHCTWETRREIYTSSRKFNCLQLFKSLLQNPELLSKSIAPITITIALPFPTQFTFQSSISSLPPLSISTFTFLRPFLINCSLNSTIPEKSIILQSFGISTCWWQPTKMGRFTARKSTLISLLNKSKSTTPKSYKWTVSLVIWIFSSLQTMEWMLWDFSRVSRLLKVITVILSPLLACFHCKSKNLPKIKSKTNPNL